MHQIGVWNYLMYYALCTMEVIYNLCVPYHTMVYPRRLLHHSITSDFPFHEDEDDIHTIKLD